MCGRFTLRTSTSALAEQFGALAVDIFAPRFNVAPSQPVLVVRLRPDAVIPQKELVSLRWGLIPGWAQDPAIGNRTINARSETVADKPAFRAAFRRRRCLVPADGFFEWRRGKTKQPFFIQMADERPFAMAGLWESWEGPDHSLIESCTILTTVPNALMEPIHDRMPVILPPECCDEWLDASLADPESLKHLLVPFDAEAMKVCPVSSYVNRPTNEGPECIVPIPTFF